MRDRKAGAGWPVASGAGCNGVCAGNASLCTTRQHTALECSTVMDSRDEDDRCDCATPLLMPGWRPAGRRWGGGGAGRSLL